MLFKVCGMRCQEDLDLAAQLGFSMAGFIFCEKSPRHVDPEIVRTLRTRSMLRTAPKRQGWILYSCTEIRMWQPCRSLEGAWEVSASSVCSGPQATRT